MLADGVPTSNLEVERQLLGMLMLLSEANDAEATKRAIGIVRARDFTEDHRHIFNAILALDRKNLHFGLEAVYTQLERRGRLNGAITRFDLEQMQAEGSRVLPLVPSEQALQVRALGEYREAIQAALDLRRFIETTTDASRIRARIKELSVTLERDALLHTVNTQTFRELMAQEFPPQVPIVEPILYAGDCILIVGNAKAGKSVFALQLAMAVASGGLALGSIPIERVRPVLYLNLDDKPSRVKARASFMLAAYPDGAYPEALEFAHRWPPIDRGGEGMLIDWCERHPDGVIVIDLLERIRPVRLGGIYESDYAALGPLADMAHTYGVGVVVVHHTNKQGQGAGQEFNPAQAVSGSMAVQGAVDAWLTFHPVIPEQPDTRRVTISGRDTALSQYQVTWDDFLHGWQWEGESIQQKVTSKLPHRRQQLLDAIQEAGRPLRRGEIVERMPGSNLKQVDNLIHEMKYHKPPQIVDMGDGTYQHPSEHARTRPTGSV